MTTPALPLETVERSRRWWHLAIRLAVPLVILGLLWNLADGPGAIARLGDLDWRFLILAFLAVNLQTLLSAWRWHRVAARLGLSTPPPLAVAEYYLSQVVNQSLPGGVLGDAARAVRARHQLGIGVAARAVIIERMAGQIAMFSLLAIGVCWALLDPGGLNFQPDPGHIVVIAGGGGAIALIVWMALRRTSFRWSQDFGDAAWRSLLAQRAWLEQSVLGVLVVALNLSSFALCAHATGTSLNAEAILVLVPMILCAMLIPATIAGWGFREGAAAALFPLAGASATAGFAASLAFGLVILVASLPGLLVLLPSRNRLSQTS